LLYINTTVAAEEKQIALSLNIYVRSMWYILYINIWYGKMLLLRCRAGSKKQDPSAAVFY